MLTDKSDELAHKSSQADAACPQTHPFALTVSVDPGFWGQTSASGVSSDFTEFVSFKEASLVNSARCEASQPGICSASAWSRSIWSVAVLFVRAKMNIRFPRQSFYSCLIRLRLADLKYGLRGRLRITHLIHTTLAGCCVLTKKNGNERVKNIC